MRAYFHAVNTAVSGQGDAYRIGGDEVGLVLPNCSQRDAIVVVRRASQLLEREQLKYNGVDLPSISVAAGLTVVTTTTNSPEDLKRLTDKAMYKAKAFTFGRQPRPSSLSLDEEELVLVIE